MYQREYTGINRQGVTIMTLEQEITILELYVEKIDKLLEMWKIE